jgi:hypothetical protein
VLHKQDEQQGLRLQDGRALLVAIEDQFAVGLDGLHVYDRRYISRGHDNILALLAAHKKAWLSGIHLARQTYLASEDKERDGMRTFMLHWLAQV